MPPNAMDTLVPGWRMKSVKGRWMNEECLNNAWVMNEDEWMKNGRRIDVVHKCRETADTMW